MSNFNIDLDKIDINVEVPFNEPERQYYYMALLRSWFKKESERLGRTLTYSICTFGCPEVTVTEIFYCV